MTRVISVFLPTFVIRRGKRTPVWSAPLGVDRSGDLNCPPCWASGGWKP